MSTYAEAAYGTGNLGDDAILAGLRASISPQTIAVSYHPAIVEQPAIHHDELTEHIKPGDTFIVGGGGLFFAPGNVTALRDRALDLKGRGARIEVRGLGTEGPGEQAVDSARELFAAASCAEVRSRRSMAFLARIGVSGARYAPDLAHALLRPAPRPRRNVVGFVSSVPDGDDGALEQVGAACRDLVAAGFCVEHLAHARHADCAAINDLLTGERLRAGLGQPERFASLSFENHARLIEHYATVRAIVGMRYHSLVLARMAGTPVYGLTTAEKHRGYCEEWRLPGGPLGAVPPSRIVAWLRSVLPPA